MRVYRFTCSKRRSAQCVMSSASHSFITLLSDDECMKTRTRAASAFNSFSASTRYLMKKERKEERKEERKKERKERKTGEGKHTY